jgi:hypothetical protein
VGRLVYIFSSNNMDHILDLVVKCMYKNSIELIIIPWINTVMQKIPQADSFFFIAHVSNDVK